MTRPPLPVPVRRAALKRQAPPPILPPPTRSGVALALGAGGARGLAHIVTLEALDELGVRPVAIAGASMGAIVGAAYAAGMTGAELREYTLKTLRGKPAVLAKLLKARVGRFSDFFAGRSANPVLIDGERFLDLFWPSCVPDRFEQLQLPFMAVATDFHNRREIVFKSGPLTPAVAGSMAIPGLVRPVEIDDLILIDGGIIDPLPYRALIDMADVVIACDVTGGPVAERAGVPAPYETMLGAAQILQGAITAEMLKTDAPAILLKPGVEHFRALDFFKATQILEAAEAAKDVLKRRLDLALSLA